MAQRPRARWQGAPYPLEGRSLALLIEEASA